MSVVVAAATGVIHIDHHRCIRTPPTRPVVPVERRMVAVPTRSPEPVIDIRTIVEYRFDHVGGTVDILITDHLHLHRITRFILLHIDRGDILIDILGQNGLQYDQVLQSLVGLDHAQIVHLSVTVQIQVRER